jgi:hypothetical protein
VPGRKCERCGEEREWEKYAIEDLVEECIGSGSSLALASSTKEQAVTYLADKGVLGLIGLVGKLVCREAAIRPKMESPRVRFIFIDGTGPMAFVDQLVAPSIPSALLEAEVRRFCVVAAFTECAVADFSLSEPEGDLATGLWCILDRSC